MLTYKMAIALRPQICDATSPYVYIALQSNRQCYPTITMIMIGTCARRNIAFAHCTTPSAPKTAQNTISSHRSVQSLHGKNSCRLRVYMDNEKLLKWTQNVRRFQSSSPQDVLLRHRKRERESLFATIKKHTKS